MSRFDKRKTTIALGTAGLLIVGGTGIAVAANSGDSTPQAQPSATASAKTKTEKQADKKAAAKKKAAKKQSAAVTTPTQAQEYAKPYMAEHYGWGAGQTTKPNSRAVTLLIGKKSDRSCR